MMRFLLPLVLLASPALAQDGIATRLDKARTEINTTENAADRAVAACQRGDVARCGTEARTAANAASRALYAVDKARELVAPVPTPTPTLSGTLSEGDSNSVFWSGNHTGIYAAQHPGETFYGKAVGGSTLADLEARFAADAALRPARVTVLIGGNYMAPTFLADLAAYAARWQATGAKVYLATLLPKCDAAFNAQRGPANAGIRQIAVTGIIDFAADPVIGPDAAGCDKALYHDGVHLTEAGQQRAALVYGAKLDGKPAPGVPPTGDVPAPAPDTPATFQISLGLQPAWGDGSVPGPYAQDEGAFRFVCAGNGPLASDDPVLHPGQPGRSHLHQVWGNTTFDAFLTPERLLQSAETNCNLTPHSLNRSSYWMPALLHDSGQVVQPDLVLVYYKRKISASEACRPGSPRFVGVCVPLPNQIRFIFGWDPKAPAAPVQGASWYCTGSAGHFKDLDAMFAAGCGPGDTMVANTLAPNCWDGERLDSPDHRSHVAYVTYEDGTGVGRCPRTHPYLFPQEENKAQFLVTADMIGTDGRSRIRLSSDAMLQGAKPGQTLHADYMEAWLAQGKALWHTHCIEKALNCSGGDLGDGTQLVGAGQPPYGWLNPSPRVPAPPHSGVH